MKYRMYIDEVGNSDMASSTDVNHRYLSLTGVIFELTFVQSTIHPSVEDLKHRYFDSHPDEPLILHRRELVRRRHPFTALRDRDVERRFNTELLTMLSDLEYTVITAVMDKLEHNRRYQTWRFDPYHYCLTILLERYVRWLERHNAIGDVMAESRGGKEDRRLKDSFERLYKEGTDFVPPESFESRLTSRQLKVKQKSNNIAGLQIADLIAHPSYRAVLARRENRALPTDFGGQIAKILDDSKYDRSPSGSTTGVGMEMASIEKGPEGPEDKCLPPPDNWITLIILHNLPFVNINFT